MNHEKPELSKKNKYYISKHRYYELKHYCLQYPEWRSEYARLSEIAAHSTDVLKVSCRSCKDETGDLACSLEYYRRNTITVENACRATSFELGDYVLKAVTEGLSYECLQTVYNIPCSRDMYYELYRKFFYILNSMK